MMARMSDLLMPIPNATVATTMRSLLAMNCFWMEARLAADNPAWYDSALQEMPLRLDFDLLFISFTGSLIPIE